MYNKEAGRRPLEVITTLNVQTYDIDFEGIVNTTTYVRWLEDLRLYFFNIHLPLDALLKEGSIPIVQTTDIEFKRPIRLFDQVTGYFWMSELVSSKWIGNMEIVVNDKIATTAVQQGIFISLATSKPSIIPETLQKKYDGDISKK
ncbi:MAG: thioesterase family protein [Smithella sp.]|jgi:acyl-CoA thioester hydrolase